MIFEIGLVGRLLLIAGGWGWGKVGIIFGFVYVEWFSESLWYFGGSASGHGSGHEWGGLVVGIEWL